MEMYLILQNLNSFEMTHEKLYSTTTSWFKPVPLHVCASNSNVEIILICNTNLLRKKKWDSEFKYIYVCVCGGGGGGGAHCDAALTRH